MIIDLPQIPGIFDLSLEAGLESIALRIPDGYESIRSYPLILVLHWGGQAQAGRGKSILRGLVIPALGSLDAIMVAPDCSDEDWETHLSETRLLDLLDFLQRSYPIDPRQCLMIGYSMGAKGAWSLVSRHQEKFCAMIPVSALPPKGMSEINWQIPLYVIHSKHDELFPLKSTQDVVNQLKSRGVDIELCVVKGATHYNVGGFVSPLQGAIPWIQRVWEKT